MQIRDYVQSLLGPDVIGSFTVDHPTCDLTIVRHHIDDSISVSLSFYENRIDICVGRVMAGTNLLSSGVLEYVDVLVQPIEWTDDRLVEITSLILSKALSDKIGKLGDNSRIGFMREIVKLVEQLIEQARAT